MSHLLTQDLLKGLLHYEPETGVFTRLTSPVGSVKVGSLAGNVGHFGYRVIEIKAKAYKAHRLAWLYVYGEWPKHQIDHINGNRDDNRIENLRDVTRVVNGQNQRKPQSGNQAGYLGVSKNRNAFSAVIGLNGKQVFLGRFKTPEEAHEVYLAAKRAHHEGCTI